MEKAQPRLYRMFPETCCYTEGMTHSLIALSREGDSESYYAKSF